MPGAVIEELLRTLAAEAQSYRLPFGHGVAHAELLNRNALDPTEKSLIFDGFVALSPNVSLLMTWPSAGLRFSSNGTANPVEPALRVEAFEVGIISFGFKCLMSKSLDYQLHQSFNQASEFIRGLITVWF